MPFSVTFMQRSHTYAYETTYHWDKELKQSRLKRKCIGKVDPVTKEIIPTRGRASKNTNTTVLHTQKSGPIPLVSNHLYYGATYLLEELSDSIGLTAEWDYTQERPYKNDIAKDKRRIYIHYYCSIEKGSDDELAFDKRISSLCKELQSGKLIESHKSSYEQFFEVRRTPVRGTQVYYKEDAIKAARKYLGYFALITNEKMDAFTALYLYRMKDVVEKAFGNIKERLNMRRLLVSSEKSLDGNIFVEFVALILISCLDHRMKQTDLYKDLTLTQLLDKLEVIECFEDDGHSLRVGELLDKQKEIYNALSVKIPTSSC